MVYAKKSEGGKQNRIHIHMYYSKYKNRSKTSYLVVYQKLLVWKWLMILVKIYDDSSRTTINSSRTTVNHPMGKA